MRKTRSWALCALALVPLAVGRFAVAETPRDAYAFVPAAVAGTVTPLSARFAVPDGARRPALPAQSYGAWLRELPLLADGAPVLLFDGRQKPRQDVHAAVVAMDVPARDLQQCADAIMRLRAEYLLASKRSTDIVFHPDPGKPRALRYSGGTRADFMRYLTRVFVEAGSASLQAELVPVNGPAQPGDVLIQGGHPGHAVIVLDVAEASATATRAGKRYVLLAQSYMPAQSLHVLKNPGAPSDSPWYDEAALDGGPGLATPEWRPFRRKDLYRFPVQ